MYSDSDLDSAVAAASLPRETDGSRGDGKDREVRVTRYSPQGTRSREQAFAELSDEQLKELFEQSQPSFTSPEAGYRR